MSHDAAPKRFRLNLSHSVRRAYSQPIPLRSPPATLALSTRFYGALICDLTFR